MRKPVLLILFLVPCFLSTAQVSEKLYYNKLWRLTKKDSSVFYRICTIDTAEQVFSAEVKDYTKDDKLIMTGMYRSGEKNGQFITYYRNGQKESEGTFEDNVRTGVWRYYYANGTPRQEVQFGSYESRILFYNDSSGTKLMVDGTGSWKEEYVETFTAAKIVTKGNFKNHLKDGAWSSSLANGTPWVTAMFKDGKFLTGEMVIEGVTFELFGAVKNLLPLPYKFQTTESFAFGKGVTRANYPHIRSLPSKPEKSQGSTDEVYSIAEFSAYPVGGLPAFYKAVGTHVVYPPEAKKVGIEGRVFVEFVINKNGSLSDFKIIKGLGKGCDEEAIRAIKASQATVKWKPAIQLRKLVRQKYTLPIPFKLS